jgi:hypothetical protein
LLLGLFLRTCWPLFLVGSVFFFFGYCTSSIRVSSHIFFNNRSLLADFGGVLYIMFTLRVL